MSRTKSTVWAGDGGAPGRGRPGRVPATTPGSAQELRTGRPAQCRCVKFSPGAQRQIVRTTGSAESSSVRAVLLHDPVDPTRVNCSSRRAIHAAGRHRRCGRGAPLAQPTARGAADLRGSASAVGERHHLGPRQRDVGRTATCPRRWGRAWRSSTTTTTAGWTSSWSTAARPTSTRRQRRSRTRSTRTTATARSPTSPTRRASPAASSSAWACAVGDFDNDGYPDILVTAYGPRTLYKNNGNGTFTDVTDEVRSARARRTGRPAPSGSTTTTTASSICFSAASCEFSLKSNIFCGDNKLGKRFYCIPRVFKPTPSALYPQQRRRHVHRGERRHRHPEAPSARRWASSPPTSTTTG